MSKRPCPFEENNAPQRKVHVSTDDVNRQNEEYQRELEARTMARLHEAANAKATAMPLEKVNCDDIRTCPECQKKGLLIHKCWFCELLLCQECVRLCTRCSENFCSRCSVAIYKFGNNYTCLTCYN